MTLSSLKKQAEQFFQSAQQLVRDDHYGAAIEALDQAIQLAPTAELYDYRGVVLALVLNNEAALESFTNALSLARTDDVRAEISFHRGLLYGREKLYEQALLDLARACRLNRFAPTYREALDQLQKEMSGHSHL